MHLPETPHPHLSLMTHRTLLWVAGKNSIPTVKCPSSNDKGYLAFFGRFPKGGQELHTWGEM